MPYCVICLSKLTSSQDHLKLSCPHYIDADCLKDAFLSATRDRQMMPPRCCGLEIAFRVVDPYLTKAQAQTYRIKQEQWAKEDLRTMGKKGGWERNATREEEVMMGGLVEGGKSLFKQCPGCCRIIEKDVGCKHMTCVCKTEWCFTCGMEWQGGYVCGCSRY